LRLEAVKVYLVADPRFNTTPTGVELMTIVFLKNPDGRQDRDGKARYSLLRVSASINVTKTPWLKKLRKGDPVYVAGNFEFRQYPLKDGSLGCELEIPFVDRFEPLVNLRERVAAASVADRAPRTVTPTSRQQRIKQAAPAEALPEGLDD
jgi:hypothetical protein